MPLKALFGKFSKKRAAALDSTSSPEYISPSIPTPTPNASSLENLNPEQLSISKCRQTRGPEALAFSIPAGIDTFLEMRAEQIMAHYDKAQTIMAIALEKPIEYNEYAAWHGEQLSDEELDKQYRLLFGNWDKLKSIMILYCKLDPDLSCFMVLITKFGLFPTHEILDSIYRELLYPSPITRNEMTELLKELQVLTYPESSIATFRLLRFLEVKYNEVCKNPPPPKPVVEHTQVRRLTNELRKMISDGTSTPATMAPLVAELEAEMKKLPIDDRTQYRLPREYLTEASDTPMDEDAKAKYKTWRATVAPHVIAGYATLAEKQEIYRELKETQKEGVGIEAEDEGEGVGAKDTPDLALARLNGWV